MEVFASREQLVYTNQDFVRKSEVDPPLPGKWRNVAFLKHFTGNEKVKGQCDFINILIFARDYYFINKQTSSFASKTDNGI